MTNVKKLEAARSGQKPDAVETTATHHAREQAISHETRTPASHQPAPGCSQKFVGRANDVALREG